MRRRGTYLICDICTNGIFVKNLKPYKQSRWKRIGRLKVDICPNCAELYGAMIDASDKKLSWDDIVMSVRSKTAAEKIVNS